MPEGATLPTDSAQTFIGNMNGGTSTRVSWTVVFEEAGTYTLQVNVSGLDSNGSPCAASQSTTVHVSGGSPPPESPEPPPWTLYAVLTTIGIISIAGGAGALAVRKRKQVKPSNDFKH